MGIVSDRLLLSGTGFRVTAFTHIGHRIFRAHNLLRPHLGAVPSMRQVTDTAWATSKRSLPLYIYSGWCTLFQIVFCYEDTFFVVMTFLAKV